MSDSKNILLVEDDEDDQYFFIEALKEISNTNLLAIANNGREALEILQHVPVLPDVIFMDINMPLLNGMECLEAMGKKALIKDIPVVMLSTDLDSIELLRQKGAKAFIKKPTDINILIQKIEQIMSMNFQDDEDLAETYIHPLY